MSKVRNNGHHWSGGAFGEGQKDLLEALPQKYGR